jgi:hypothetical protein
LLKALRDWKSETASPPRVFIDLLFIYPHTKMLFGQQGCDSMNEQLIVGFVTHERVPLSWVLCTSIRLKHNHDNDRYKTASENNTENFHAVFPPEIKNGTHALTPLARPAPIANTISSSS